MQLTEPAIDHDYIRVQLVARSRLAVATGNHLTDARVVVVDFARRAAGRGRCDLVSPVLVFERPAIHKANLTPDGLAALQVRDVNALDAADGLIQSKGFLKRLQALLGVLVVVLCLGLPVVLRAASLVEFFNRLDLVAQDSGLLVGQRFTGRHHFLPQFTQ